MAEKGKYKGNAKRWLLVVLSAIYVLVAAMNHSLVQSYAGAVASASLSRQWGGTFRIGAVDANPFSHLILHKVLLVSPTGDTIFNGERVDCRFHSFPLVGNGLKLDRVKIKNTRFHFASYTHHKNNLSYIINHYVRKKDRRKAANTFHVEVGEVLIDGVDYVMDLPNPKNPTMLRKADSLAVLAAPRSVSIPHMRFLGIQGRIRDVDVEGDHVKCRILQLSTTEAGGMRVDDLAARVEVSRTGIEAKDMKLYTGTSVLLCDARLEYDGWKSMKDYCHNVWHDLYLKPGSRVNVNESSWWAPVLWGVDCPVSIEGHCYGSIDNLHVDTLSVAFGAESRLTVDGTVTGLPVVRNMLLDMDVHGGHLSLDDVSDVGLPDAVRIESHLSRFVPMAYLDLDAEVKGGANDLSARVELGTAVGDIKANLETTYDSAHCDYAYVGRVQSRALGILSLLPNEWVSRTGVDLVLEGRGMSIGTMSTTIDGTLVNTRVRGHDLSQTTLSAQIEKGTVRLLAAIDDTLISCSLKGLLGLADGSCRLKVDVDHARLSDLGLAGRPDSALTLSTHLTADLRHSAVATDASPILMPWSQGLECMTGTVQLKNTRCQIGSRDVLQNEVLLSVVERSERKTLSLACDWFDLAVDGWFSYSDFPMIVRDFAARYLPGGNLGESEAIGGNPSWRSAAFDVDMTWKDLENTASRLVPGLHVASGSTVHGNYNYSESLKLVVRSSEVSFGTVTVQDLGLSSGVQGNAYAMRLQTGGIALSGTDYLQSLKVNADMGRRLSTLALRWGDKNSDEGSAADLEFFLTSGEGSHKLMVTRPELYFLGVRWNVVCPDGILFADGGVDIPLLKVYGNGQSLSLNSHLGKGDDDYVKAVFSDFSLSALSNIFLAGRNLHVDGIVDGTFNLMDIGTTPYFEANLAVDELRVNNQSAGRVEISSNWEASEKRVYVDLSTEKHFPDHTSRPVEIHGFFLADGSDGMDVDVDMHRISLQTIAPMIAGFSSNVDGLLSGRLHVGGTMKAPDLQGLAWVDGGLLHVDITGVTYYFDDTVNVVSDTLLLNNFAVRDGKGNRARLGGNIVYRDEELLLDLALNTDRIQVLDNKPDSDTFFGRLLVGAEGRLTGSMRNPEIFVQARTLEGSEIHVPVNNRKQMNEDAFVHFVSYDNNQRRQSPAVAKGGNLNLHLDLSVTPGVRLFLPMDFSEIGADVEARGSGNLRLTLQGNRSPSIVGSYEFSSGRFSLSLLRLIEKNFSIEQGSTLVFPGNVQDARFDIKAVYNQRVNLSTLTGTAVSGSTGEYAQVQNVIALAGTIENPSLKFDIRLPNADQGTVDQVNSLINLSNDRDMLNQTVSLLLLGRFANTGTSGVGDDLLNNGLNSINVLASSMSSIVSNMVKVVDVDFKVQQDAVAGTSQIDVGISKQWNKLYFESSFGYGANGAAGEYAPELANVLVGDVVVGYRINPYFSFYGFHRTNTSYYTRSEIPYKQGLGLKWTKDFDSFGDLFRRNSNGQF